MTTAHVEKFAELVGKDPALLAKLGLDKVNADAAAAAASAAAPISRPPFRGVQDLVRVNKARAWAAAWVLAVYPVATASPRGCTQALARVLVPRFKAARVWALERAAAHRLV